MALYLYEPGVREHCSKTATSGGKSWYYFATVFAHPWQV